MSAKLYVEVRRRLTSTSHWAPRDHSDPKVLEHRHHLALFLSPSALELNVELGGGRSRTSLYIALCWFCIEMNGVKRLLMAYSGPISL